ncbi:MAG: dethiobiotin synthase [Bacteroidetes bacterium]|nr:dethiobiotin synthase [Bacteroidota bacterium]
MRNIFVTGIGTDVGKTVVSAILAEALQYDYWKPVQSGSFYGTDSITVRNLVKSEKVFVHPEAILLKHALSPHAAAEQEGIHLDAEKIELPKSNNRIIIEGSGGVLVPLNHHYFVADMIKKFDCEAVVVIQNYLGSTNHSLLSLEALKVRNIPIKGLVFNGAPHKPTEEIITHFSGAKIIGRVLPEKAINTDVIQKYAQQFKEFLFA